MFSFLSHLLLPFLDSYWATLIQLLSIADKED